MKNKKQFTLIELIIVIVVIGILAAMALPKFNNIIRDAKVAAMINDKEVLEKTLILYNQKHDELPLLSNDEELIADKGLSLTKIVFAEENISDDMQTIYISLQETLKHYDDNEENLYRININELKDDFSKDIKNGHKKSDKDFFVYSTKTNNVYYYGSMFNGNGTIQHDEYDTLLKEDKLISKIISTDPSINKAPKIELVTDLSKITIEKDVKWEYTFSDEDTTPTKISFILDGVEYNNIDKIPTKLEEGEHTLKIKMQDSKGLWSNEIIRTFGIARGLVSLNIGEQIASKIDLDGNLYLWGSNSYGALGIGTESGFFEKPQLISLPNQVKVKDIKLSFHFTIALGKDNNIYSWGFNSYGQVGVGNNEQQNIPQKVLLPENISIKEISTGMYHSLALSSDGDLYSWGDNRYGQLGIGNNDNQNIPQKVNFPEGVKIKEMQSGRYHSIVIGTDDNVYTWGYNNKGVLLTGDTKNQNLPIKMQLPEGLKPIKVYADEYQSMILCNDGNLYAAGSNYYGALGTGDITNKYIPTKVALPENVKPIEIALGTAYGLVIGDDKNIYSWGWNTNGQLGIGNMTNKSIPQKVILPNGDIPKKIIAYSQASLAICENGNIYFWGSDPRSLFKISDSTRALVPTLQTGI